VGGHVGHARRLPGGAGRRDRGRVADLPGGRVRPRRQGANRADAQLATGEGAQAVEGVARARVGGRPRLEQRQRPLGAVGAHTASTRRSSSLSVSAPGWRPMPRILASADLSG
jgi:hypothetical protein